MKMRWYDRVLVSLSGVVLIALGAFVMLSGGGVVDLPEPLALDTWAGAGWQWMPMFFVAGLLVVAWGLRLFLFPILRRGESGGRYYAVRGGGEDSVHISVQALDRLVHKCLDRYGEIMTAGVKIAGQEDAMRILLRITVCSGVLIPALVERMRAEIKRYVEQCAGVTVESIRVVVEAAREKEARAGTPEPVLQAAEETPRIMPMKDAAEESDEKPDTAAISSAQIAESDIFAKMPAPLPGGVFPFPGEKPPEQKENAPDFGTEEETRDA